MKTEIKEQDSSRQLLSAKKSHGKRRGRKKSRTALLEGSEDAGDERLPTSHDVTSDVTSQSGGVTSDAAGCEACQVQTNNPAQLAIHLKSKRHARRRRELRILAALSEAADPAEGDAAAREAVAAQLARGNARLDDPTPLKDSELPDCITKTCAGKVRQKVSYSCGLCGVQLTSLVKTQEHLVSQRHTALQQGLPPPARPDRRSARKAKTKAAARQSWFW